jgi:hypothetical protein
MRTDQNERVTLAEIHGLGGRDVRECLAELQAIAEGTRTTNGFYVASLNPCEDEQLTPEQWAKAEEVFRRTMGLEDQPYFVVEHEKDGRTHRHIVAGRIDAETMKAIPADFNFQKHEIASREIERELGLTPVESVLVKDRETPRQERRDKDWERFRDADRGFDREAMKRELTALWHEADSGMAFRAALEDAGYILARGDRRDFCVIDETGKEHSLARCIDGFKAAQIRERMADVDPTTCPSVAEGRQMARDAAQGDAGAAQPQAVPEPITAASGAPQTGETPLKPEAPLDVQSLRPEPPTDEPLQPQPQFNGEPHEPHRASPWGYAWRVFSDAAAGASERFSQYLRDESSGTPQEEGGPWARLVGKGRDALMGWMRRDGEAEKKAALEAAKIIQEEIARRVFDAPVPDRRDRHHPPDGQDGDDARHGAFVDAPQPDALPQDRPAALREEVAPDPFGHVSEWLVGYGDDREDDAQDVEYTPDPEQPEPDGLDIEP